MGFAARCEAAEPWAHGMSCSQTHVKLLDLGKSIAETILVGAIAVIAYLNVSADVSRLVKRLSSRDRSRAGPNDVSRSERVEVQLFIDGKLSGTQTANLATGCCSRRMGQRRMARLQLRITGVGARKS